MLTVHEATKQEKRFIAHHLLVAIIALSIGTLFGPLQAFEHAGLDIYPYIAPVIKSYYQGLSIHGVLNALVWTTFFITGFINLTTIVGLRRPLRTPRLNRTGFWVMVVGLVTTAVPLLLDEATVLFTFYPPLKANWAFYVGLVLVVVGSWIEGWGFMATYRAWRRDNPGVRSPFVAWAGIITVTLWQIATLGIATEILTMLLPWSLGLIDAVDPQLARTFFWFTGHPLVYYWLLPAYISWYGMLPRQAGGKLFSDSLARLSFWLFLILSTPVGFHHQYLDPGVPIVWKTLHSALTFGVFFPSLLTLFTVVASLEYAARKRGGKGLFGWVRALPWGDPSVTAQLLAGILFMFGGISGLTNASYSLNLVIHNTMWVPGHFHLTVASAVTLSFMGISYWLVPHLTGRALWKPRLAVIQGWVWFVGMLIFSNAMHVLGLVGAPRRTSLGQSPYVPDDWNGALFRVAVGGAILFVSAVLYVLVMIRTARNKETAEVEVPIAESIHDPQQTPGWLDNWKGWLIATGALILLSYGPQIISQVSNAQFNAPGLGG